MNKEEVTALLNRPIWRRLRTRSKVVATAIYRDGHEIVAKLPAGEYAVIGVSLHRSQGNAGPHERLTRRHLGALAALGAFTPAEVQGIKGYWAAAKAAKRAAEDRDTLQDLKERYGFRWKVPETIKERVPF